MGAEISYQGMGLLYLRKDAGIVVFNAERIRQENLSKKLYETRIALGDRASMDQQTFNIICKK